MKFNGTLNEVIRGIWMLEPQYVLQSAPLLSSFFEGVAASGSKPQGEEQNPEAAVFNIYAPDGELYGHRIEDKTPAGSTAVIGVKGAIIKEGDYCSWGADEITNMIYRADRDPKITEIILDLDTPGGSVNAIAPFIECGQNITTPVRKTVDQCCSLGMWIACAFPGPIMASNTISLTTGSVGVQLSFMDAKPYYEKQGYKFHRITPPESYEKNEIFEKVLAGDYDQINKEVLSPMAVKFQNAVKAFLPKLVDEPGVLNGKTYNYEESMRVGFIQGTSSVRTMLEDKKKRAQLTEYRRSSAHS
ncbi:hypothetical protein [Nonlabens dokdonensis]|uniref:hypothetical protein n=1 Tax=Nonlabens dokdonensis TaxID=328515 RepID=UPI0026EA5174|nr:hypothetical protein [Nonlabens dokdonensis]